MAALADVGTRLSERGKSPSLEVLQALFATVDQNQLRHELSSRVRYELWDHESPLNGAGAVDVKQRSDYIEGGSVYLVFVDDQLAIVQMTVPGQPGLVPMTPVEAATFAQQDVDRFVSMMLLDAVTDRVSAVLDQVGG